MKVLDIGCAMGFFSLPLARMVGSSGKVICVDLQEKMIKSLEKRVQKKNYPVESKRAYVITILLALMTLKMKLILRLRLLLFTKFLMLALFFLRYMKH